MAAVPGATNSVDSMDTAKALDGGSASEQHLPLPADSSNATPPPEEASRSRFVVAVYAYSALLALLAAGLCLIGPLHGLAPVRLIIPQAAMFGVIAVLFVIADRVPVELPFRGTTHALLLNEVPLLFGLAFLAPNILVLASICGSVTAFAVLRRQDPMKVAYNVASLAFATALAATVFRELLGTRIRSASSAGPPWRWPG